MPIKRHDFIVIGGGFAGTAIAYHLSKVGKDVLLLEANSLCSGTSGACAGRAQVIESNSDEYLELVLSGIKRLEILSEELEIDLEWIKPGHLTLLRNEKEWNEYSTIINRLAKHSILAEMLDLKCLQEAEPLLKTDQLVGAALSLEGHLNPFKFCFGFANAAKRLGAEILIDTPVTAVQKVGTRIDAVVTPAGTYSAETYVIAGGAWTDEILSLANLHLPIHYSHAEAIVSEPLPPMLNHHIGVSGFYESVHGTDRTVTLGLGQHPNGTLVISNAIQQAVEIDLHSTSWGMPAIALALEDFFPQLCGFRVMRTWAAPSPFLPDYNPALGWLPGTENLYIAAGFHLAIPTIPVLAEQIATYLVEDKETPLLHSFSPARFENVSKIQFH